MSARAPHCSLCTRDVDGEWVALDGRLRARRCWEHPLVSKGFRFVRFPARAQLLRDLAAVALTDALHVHDPDHIRAHHDVNPTLEDRMHLKAIHAELVERATQIESGPLSQRRAS